MISEHISFKEGTFSATATRLGLPNAPSKDHLFNMQMIAMIPPIFTMDYMIIDVPLSAFSYAVGGAAIGWALDRFK